MCSLRRLGIIAFGSVALAAPVGAQTGTDTTLAASASRLAPTSAPPWNPPRAVSRSEPWEAALQLPGRILSLPLSGLGWLGEEAADFVEASNVVPRTLELLDIQRRVGIYIAPASLADRTGTGVEVRFVPNVLKRSLLAELSASTRQYNRERIALRLGPLRPIYASEWRSRDLFYGVGLETAESGQSAFAQSSQSFQVALVYPFRDVGYEALRVAEVAAVHPSSVPADHPIRTQVAVWAGPRYARVSNGRDPRVPSFETLHPIDAARSLYQPVEHLTWGGRLVIDRRLGAPHWSRGWKLRFEGQRFDRSIEALGLKSASTDARLFTRLSGQVETGFSWGRSPRTIRLGARVVDQHLGEGDGVFLISDLSTLGGGEFLRGYESGRFRDVDLVAAEAKYIFPLTDYFELDAHIETGGVFSDLADAQVKRFTQSYGVMLRARNDESVLGQAGIEWSREQVRFRFSFGVEP